MKTVDAGEIAFRDQFRLGCQPVLHLVTRLRSKGGQFMSASTEIRARNLPFRRQRPRIACLRLSRTLW